MATSSAQAGFLAPTQSPEYDDAFDNAFHDIIAGITGIPGNLVRPRWQPEPPQQPSYTTNWVAFGVTSVEPDKHAYVNHDGAEFTVERDEAVTVTMSFYGPLAMSFAQRFIDGLELGQNRADLRALGVAVLYAQSPVQVPALLDGRWLRKVDVQLMCARRTSRKYAVHTIESAQPGLDNEQWVTPLSVNQP